MRRTRLLAVGVSLISLAGCGGGANDVLSETADRLGEIRSGTLDLALMVEPRGGKAFGFEIKGPFELRGAARLPVMDVAYTRIVEGRRATVKLVSDGNDVHAETNGSQVELTSSQVEELRGAAKTLGGGLTLPLEDWFEDPKVSDGGSTGGAETDRVSGDLDIVAVVNGLSGLAGLRTIRESEADRLKEATESATFELYTGKEDRLLRRLEMSANFGFGVPEDLREALGTTVGAKVTFRLAIANPNS